MTDSKIYYVSIRQYLFINRKEIRILLSDAMTCTNLEK